MEMVANRPLIRRVLRLMTTIAVALALTSCEKPNPHPELLDPIFADLERELKAAEGEYKAAEKQLEEFKEALRKVVPQTGQVKFAQKRVYDTEAVLQKLQQRIVFLTIRIESRKKFAKESYMAAYKKKEAWPKPAEFEEYRAQQAFEKAPKSWNAKGRLEAAKSVQKVPAGEHGAKPPESH
jgi:hypothetical protein